MTNLGPIALGLPFFFVACAWPPLESRLQEIVDLGQRGGSDQEGLRALNSLNRQLADSDLPELEAFALRDTSRAAAFGFVRILLERNRFEGAAKVALKALQRDEHPDYRMWKWWDSNFKEHPRSKELGKGFMDAILAEFDRGDDARRLHIARVFRLGEPESHLSTEEFKRKIGYTK
jgi:hypothetical protein